MGVQAITLHLDSPSTRTRYLAGSAGSAGGTGPLSAQQHFLDHSEAPIPQPLTSAVGQCGCVKVWPVAPVCNYKRPLLIPERPVGLLQVMTGPGLSPAAAAAAARGP